MYTSFAIENFRLFDRLTIEPLARVNLIVGKNNAGKTALLEALWLHSGPNNPELGVRLAAFRGIVGPDHRRFMHDLFHKFNPELAISMSAAGTWGESRRVLRIKSQPIEDALRPVPVSGTPLETAATAVSSSLISLDYCDESKQTYASSGWWVKSDDQVVNVAPNVQMAMASAGMASQKARMPIHPSCVFLGSRQRTSHEEDVQRFGEAELAGYADRIVECLKAVDARIQRLTTIAASPAPMVYADVGLSRPVPIGFLGDGMGRFLSMSLAFYQARDGIILLDEVENGLHHSVLKDVWKKLNWLSIEFKVQVFATTHSYECMEAARDAFKDMEDDNLLIHRIGRRENGIVATTYSFEGLDFTLDYGAEIR